jgi:hypothetical protein
MMSQRNVLETSHVDKNIDLIYEKMRNDFATDVTKWPIDTVAMQLIRSLSTTLFNAGAEAAVCSQTQLRYDNAVRYPSQRSTDATAGSCEIRFIVGIGNNLELLSVP